MTTIAIRDRTIAADSLTTNRGARVGSTRKIVGGPSGAFGAVAGDSGDAHAFRVWIEAGCQGEPPKFGDNDSEALLLMPSGEVRWYTNCGLANRIEADFYAIGSGSDFALGAMAYGASAAEAVEVAIRLNIHSGGPVASAKLAD